MNSTKKICYVDLDGVLADFWGKLTELHPELLKMKEFEKETHDYVDHLLEYKQPGIFNILEPMPFAIESFEQLAEHYDVYLLSTPSWVAPLSYTHKRWWVEKWLGKYGYKKLILSHNKGLLKGSYLIDDRTAHGVDNFEGEHIHFGTEKFPGWREVIEYLKEKDKW